MTEFSKYLGGVKAKLAIKNDYQLSIKSGIAYSTIQSWMKAGKVPEDDVCIKIANLAGDDPARVILLAHKAKASDVSKPYWNKIFKTCAATILVFVLCISVFNIIDPLPSMIGGEHAQFDTLYIMSNRTLCVVFVLLGLLYLLLRLPAASLLPLVLVFVFSVPAFANENNKWTTTDTIGQSLVTAALIGDWSQSVYIANHPNRFYETNAILGHHPHPDKVHAYFAACAIGHAAVSYFLPRKIEIWGLSVPARTIWQGVWFGIEVNQIRSNYALGVGWAI